MSVDALQNGNDPSLPPLMNPSMLEASDDLTNLSYLNEPAGMLSFNLRAALRRDIDADWVDRQFCKRSDFDTPRRRYIHTVV